MTQKTFAALVAAAALSACGSSNEGTGTVTISARMAPSAAPAGALTVAGGRVQVDEVWMVIRDIKLEQDGQEEVNATNGPFLLHVAGSDVNGAIVESFVIEAPVGTYDDLRFVVHKLEDGQSTGHPELDVPRAAIALALRVDGGAPIVFTSEQNSVQRIFGQFVVAAGSSPDNITLSIDPSGWFTAGNGSFLDPRLGGNQQAIENNIAASIDAFDDDDRDGNDDGPNHT
jgi:hypothetical protein